MIKKLRCFWHHLGHAHVSDQHAHTLLDCYGWSTKKCPSCGGNLMKWRY